MDYAVKGSSSSDFPKLNYTYDVMGNITGITTNTGVANAYTYDAQNQLSTETRDNNVVSTYKYDTYGNIRSHIKSKDSAVVEKYEFLYYNGSWRDRLSQVAYTNSNGARTAKTLTYDAIGNPLRYFNGTVWNFTWEYGRQMATAESDVHEISYTYDVDGIRKTKTVDDVLHEYVTMNGKVVRETYGNLVVDYIYDNARNPYKIIINDDGTLYIGYYVLNLQGDVIGLVDVDGGTLVTYRYNAWGVQTGYTLGRADASIFYDCNALKYRGYYYDAETGFYYQQSRYYDPVIGRFVNADGYVSTGQGFLGFNMYGYCLNNPVNYVDYTGCDAAAIQMLQEWWTTTMWWLCAVDAVAPVGDAVYLGGIIGLGIIAIPVTAPVDVPEIAVVPPVSGTATYYDSGYEDALDRLSKSVAKVETRIRSEKKKYDYWIATYHSFGYGLSIFSIGGPLSFSAAVSYVRSGGSVYASSGSKAYELASAVGYGSKPVIDGCRMMIGYFPHYHATYNNDKNKRRGGHIFFL